MCKKLITKGHCPSCFQPYSKEAVDPWTTGTDNLPIGIDLCNIATDITHHICPVTLSAGEQDAIYEKIHDVKVKKQITYPVAYRIMRRSSPFPIKPLREGMSLRKVSATSPWTLDFNLQDAEKRGITEPTTILRLTLVNKLGEELCEDCAENARESSLCSLNRDSSSSSGSNHPEPSPEYIASPWTAHDIAMANANKMLQMTFSKPASAHNAAMTNMDKALKKSFGKSASAQMPKLPSVPTMPPMSSFRDAAAAHLGKHVKFDGCVLDRGEESSSDSDSSSNPSEDHPTTKTTATYGQSHTETHSDGTTKTRSRHWKDDEPVPEWTEMVRGRCGTGMIRQRQRGRGAGLRPGLRSSSRPMPKTDGKDNVKTKEVGVKKKPVPETSSSVIPPRSTIPLTARGRCRQPRVTKAASSAVAAAAAKPAGVEKKRGGPVRRGKK
ncbi:hypothetical protein PMZ80_005533 [Knufia obscura]|uniref:Uncharacterized protein n=2 Tax=Knufia TaxID=430999 RepID=A0AAN8IJB6_9EURO|nr:hypothetical protein PMZ80_005533 [Knufia obscura]KAK5950002.1 hypothetical protein OHC33_008963 [Knufia fluminis]